jgi:GTP cyclohydrolase II
MNHSMLRSGAAGARAVNRAVGELRRGIAVVIHGAGGARVLALPAETATPATLEEFLAEMAVTAHPVLLLAPSRAAALPPGLARHAGRAVGQGDLSVIAIPLAATLLDTDLLRGLADPTSPRPSFPGFAGPAPDAEIPADVRQAGLLLAKLGRLLPAVLAARAAGPATALLHVDAGDVLAYPGDTSDGLVRAAEAFVPLEEAGDARVVAFRPPDGGIEHLAILIGRPEQVGADAPAPLVRVHSECFTGDLLGSRRCDCGPQLHQALRRMAAEGAGVLLYMAQEGRGIGLVNKLRAYTLQDGLPASDKAGRLPGLDTLDANRALGYGADERSFAAAATMLRRLGVPRVRLLTNNPEKLAGLTAHGIAVTGRVSHAIAANGVNDAYLETKARRFGHLLG